MREGGHNRLSVPIQGRWGQEVPTKSVGSQISHAPKLQPCGQRGPKISSPGQPRLSYEALSALGQGIQADS